MYLNTCPTPPHPPVRYEMLTTEQLRKRFPQFRGPAVDNLVALLQPDGGLVDAAMANAVHIQLARGRGATVLEKTAVLRIDTQPDGTALVPEKIAKTNLAWFCSTLPTTVKFSAKMKT